MMLHAHTINADVAAIRNHLYTTSTDQTVRWAISASYPTSSCDACPGCVALSTLGKRMNTLREAWLGTVKYTRRSVYTASARYPCY